MQSTSTAAPQSSLLLSSLSRLTSSVLGSLPLAPPSSDPLADDKLSLSSQTCAAWRAIESSRRPGERLFNDSLAEVLAGPTAMARARSRVLSHTPHLSVRTHYFDSFATVCLRIAGTPAQLVLLGAGMDTRAYRLDGVTSAVSVFEIDSAAVLDLKEELLGSVDPAPTPLCGSLVRIRSDVADPSWKSSLEEAGFDRTVRTVWLLEGLLYYLSESEVEDVFANIYELSASGSEVCFSAVTRFSKTNRPMFKSAMPDPAAFLTDVGFVETVVEMFDELAVNYGRVLQSDEGDMKESSGSKASAGVYVTCARM